MTAWLSDPTDNGQPAADSAEAGPTPSARSRSVVGHRQTVVADEPSRPMSAAADVGGVHRRRLPSEHAGVGRDLGGGAAGGGEAGRVFQLLFGQVHVERHGASRRPRRHDGHRPLVHRPHAVHRRAHGHVRMTGGDPGRPGRPGLDRPVGEPLLHRAQRRSLKAALQIARVEQRQPDPRPLCGDDDRVVHPDRLVEIVELAHRGDPGLEHLRVARGGQRRVGLGLEPRRDGVHAVPPLPEVAAACPTPKGPVEGVRVRVDQAGHHQAAEGGWRRTRGRPGSTADEHPVVVTSRTTDADRRRSPQPRPLRVPAGHGIGMRTPRSAATCRATS